MYVHVSYYMYIGMYINVSHCRCLCSHVCHTVCRCVCISLEAAVDTDVELALSYIVSNASWSTQYDLRVFSNDKTMKVSHLL